MAEQRMYGLWDSPITPGSLAASLRLSEPCWDSDGQTLGWIEGRSDRGVLVVQDASGDAPRDLTGEFSVRAFVGYGGGDFTLSHGAAYFIAQADQRIYRQELDGGPARPITPPFGAASSPAVSPDGRWLLYVHSYEDIDSVAVVDTAGKEWPAKLASGRDFFMQPAWSRDGRQAAWVAWDHPNMPWDGTELVLADLEFAPGKPPAVTAQRAVDGGPATAIFQPEFSIDGRALLFVSDAGGWGRLRRLDLASGRVETLDLGDGELSAPAWAHGMRRFAQLPSGTIVAVRSRAGFSELVSYRDGRATVLDAGSAEYTSFAHPAASPTAESLAILAAGVRQPPRVVVVDSTPQGGRATVRRRASSEAVRPGALGRARPVSWKSTGGGDVHGLYVAPVEGRFTSSGAPPLVVVVHGGPTSQVTATWDASAQFFATRGYAVLFPNYRGSTGYGRDYMLALRESWGVHDIEDCRAGAAAMAERGLADPRKLVIMGGSAGGFTVLQSLVTLPGFYRAAISSFGVGNMFTLASDTHKFEARYLDSLLGPLPEAAATYRERSPLFAVARISDPVLLFQGDIDRVVPRAQSDSIASSLRARGVPHEYHVYEGEGHGWRKSETIAHYWTTIDRFLREQVLYG